MVGVLSPQTSREQSAYAWSEKEIRFGGRTPQPPPPGFFNSASVSCPRSTDTSQMSKRPWADTRFGDSVSKRGSAVPPGAESPGWRPRHRLAVLEPPGDCGGVSRCLASRRRPNVDLEGRGTC